MRGALVTHCICCIEWWCNDLRVLSTYKSPTSRACRQCARTHKGFIQVRLSPFPLAFACPNDS